MKKWFCSFLLLFISVQCFAIENYKIGDSLTVFIKGGLSLRVKPSSKAPALLVIPMGEKVFIKKQSLRRLKLHINFAAIRTIKGYWVKVSYDGYTGYVFDGYLSSLPYPVIFKQEFYRKNNYSTEAAYLFKHFKKISTAFDTTLIPKEYGDSYYPSNTPSPYNKYKDFSLKFSDSITYTKNVHLEIGETNKMEFRQHSLDEVLLLAKAIVDTYDDEYTTNKFVYNKQSNTYMMGAVYDAGCSVSIYEKDGIVYWIQYCGC